MSDFWELLKESVITQAFITMAAMATTFYLMAAGRPIPDALTQIDLLVLGFYFGAKMGVQQGKASQAQAQLDAPKSGPDSPVG